jgi:hypothetical protein
MEQSGRKPPQMTAKAGAAEAIRVLAIRLHPLHPAARDIEGSTRLLHELGDGYGDALDHHRQVVRAACAAHDGVEVDTQGDEFFMAFAPIAALASPSGVAQEWPVGEERVARRPHRSRR